MTTEKADDRITQKPIKQEWTAPLILSLQSSNTEGNKTSDGAEGFNSILFRSSGPS